MIDPATIALASTAFAAIKKGIAFGKDIESMYKDISSWMSACHDIESTHTKVKRKKGQSVSEEAMETWAFVRKTRQQREELRLYMLSINPNAWNEFIKIEGQIRKQRQAEAEKKRRQIKRIIDTVIIIAAIFSISTAFFALIIWTLYLKRTQ